MKLSATMRSALAVIGNSGGVALAQGGGWWTNADGNVLRHNPGGDIGTRTIYALQDRGLLDVPGNQTERREHKKDRVVTEAGWDIIDQV